MCKWHNSISDAFPVISGVRQGGVLSARFWAVYMDDLINELRKSGVGCRISDYFIASILYADDVCLLAPSRKAIQVQLIPAIADLKGPTIFICYRRSSTIANIGSKEKSYQGTTKLLQFSSVIGGFPLLLDPV